MSLERVLLVDDEPNVLDGYKRSLRGRFALSTATSGAEALEKIAAEEPFAVVVSDMRMPEMNGVELLKRVRVVSPDSVRMMLTGNADQETAIQAVNQGHIFRFLNKPCPPETFTVALAMGVRQHRLITAEKELLEKTLKGSIEMLTQILSLTDPEAFVTVSKVKSYLALTADPLGLADPWALEMASILSPIGLLTLPPELKRKVNEGHPLSVKEAQAVAGIPDIGARLLSHIPRLESVANLVRCGVDHDRGDDGKLRESEQYGLSVLRLLYDLVQAERGGQGVERALDDLSQRGTHDPELLAAVHDALKHGDPTLFSGEFVVLDLTLRKLLIGDELFEDVLSEDERLLLAGGSRITGPFLERLANYRKLVGIREPIRVRRFIAKRAASSAPEE